MDQDKVELIKLELREIIPAAPQPRQIKSPTLSTPFTS